MTPRHPSIEDVRRARERIADVARRTPLVAAPELDGAAGSVFLKNETVQETGSFKVRGAANTLRMLSDDERAAGVVAVSSGNHGRAVAHVAKQLSVAATVCVSERVPANKMVAMESLGARVLVAGPSQDDADALARRLVEDEGVTFVHPFDDPRVIAGQGTLGLEIAEEVADLGLLLVPLSGGGLMAGVATAVRAMTLDAEVVAISQDRGPAMHDALQAGRIVEVVEEDTLADALAGGLGSENRHTFPMVRELVDRSVLVTEEEIAAAMRHLYETHGIRAEGGGAVGVAALLAGRITPIGKTVVVVSGGNVGDETFEAVLAGTRP